MSVKRASIQPAPLSHQGHHLHTNLSQAFLQPDQLWWHGCCLHSDWDLVSWQPAQLCWHGPRVQATEDLGSQGLPNSFGMELAPIPTENRVWPVGCFECGGDKKHCPLEHPKEAKIIF